MIAGLRISAGFELVVVRHGQTAWNADGRFQGQSDIPLDATGRAQALALGAYLSNVPFASAVASDLARATETAQAILDGRALELERDHRWREMQFGAWEGLTWKEIVERNPELAERPVNAPRFYTPQGGESFEAVSARVADAVGSLAQRARDGSRILVVTHAGPLHALLRVLLGESEAAALGVRFVPASVTRFALSADGARIVDLNRSVTDSVA
jgi:2,3-bisphosphoglycerate-dependent phosphoglycerate mutase